MAKRILTTFVLTLALAGCSAVPEPNAALDHARSEIRATRDTPGVEAHASAALERARSALERAERAWRAGSGSGQVAHLAYLASAEALIARELAMAGMHAQHAREAEEEREALRRTVRSGGLELQHKRIRDLEGRLGVPEARAQERLVRVRVPVGGEADPRLATVAAFLQINPERIAVIRPPAAASGRASAPAPGEQAAAVRRQLLDRGAPAEQVRLDTTVAAPAAPAEGGDVDGIEIVIGEPPPERDLSASAP